METLAEHLDQWNEKYGITNVVHKSSQIQYNIKFTNTQSSQINNQNLLCNHDVLVGVKESIFVHRSSPEDKRNRNTTKRCMLCSIKSKKNTQNAVRILATSIMYILSYFLTACPPCFVAGFGSFPQPTCPTQPALAGCSASLTTASSTTLMFRLESYCGVGGTFRLLFEFRILWMTRNRQWVRGRFFLSIMIFILLHYIIIQCDIA